MYVKKQANYLRISLQGLTASTKIFNRMQLNDFITTTFENLQYFFAPNQSNRLEIIKFK